MAWKQAKSRRFTMMSATSILMMLSCLGHGLAQTLNAPWRLALDASSNLYVADGGRNRVLVYNHNHVPQPGKSINSELSAPPGVPFDSKGIVYVSNLTGNGGMGSITQYCSAGVLNNMFFLQPTSGVSHTSLLWAQELQRGPVPGRNQLEFLVCRRSESLCKIQLSPVRKACNAAVM